MARKGFWQGGLNILQELDRIAATTIYNGPKRVAERVVRELQQDGPNWSGQFSNSWEIKSPATTVRGTGAPGEPVPVIAPVLTGQQVTKSFLTQDRIVFTITNFSPHALEAIDAVQHDRRYWARRKTPFPTTSLGQSKWQQFGPRSEVTYRGETGGSGSGRGEGSSRTAPLDWFATYASARLDRAVQLEMDSAINRRFG